MNRTSDTLSSVITLGVFAIGIVAMAVGFDLTTVQTLAIAAVVQSLSPWHPRQLALLMGPSSKFLSRSAPGALNDIGDATANKHVAY